MSDSLSFATVIDILRYRAQNTPHSRALVFLQDGESETASLSYAVLDQQARAVAQQLQAYAAPGERVVLVLLSSLDSIVAFLACLYAGLVAVPCVPPAAGRPLMALQAFASEAGASLALTTEQRLSDVRAQIEQIPELSTLRWLTMDRLRAKPSSPIWRAAHISSDRLVLLMYTSGSTMTPRGVTVTHAHLLKYLAGVQERQNQSAIGPSVSWAPLYHASGLANTLNPLYIGQPLILLSTDSFLERPVRWLRAISRYQAVSAGGPSFAFQLCLERVTPAEREGLDLRSWRSASCGSEPVRAQVLEQFAQTYAPYGFRRESLRTAYGLTEATAPVSSMLPGRGITVRAFDRQALAQGQVRLVSPDNPQAQVLVGCGTPVRGKRVLIVNPESCTECATTEVGEIWVGDADLVTGYWNQPQQTAEVFQAHLADTGAGPFLRTGDLGFFYEGELFIAGRLKEMLIFRGRNYYAQDIEQVAEGSHSALQAGGSAAFAIAREADDETALVLMHEVRAGYQDANVQEVAKAVRRAVAAHLELPVDSVVLVKAGSLPRTASGKIQRYRCCAQFLAQQA